MNSILLVLSAFLAQEPNVQEQIAAIDAQLQWLKPCLGTFSYPYNDKMRSLLGPYLLSEFQLRNPTARPPKDVDFPKTGGCMVAAVLPNSPAAIAGVEEFDVIYELNGKPVKPEDDFRERYESLEMGEPARIKVHRPYVSARSVQWKQKTITVKPIARKDVYLGAYDAKRDEFKRTTFYFPPQGSGTRLTWYVSHVDGSKPVIVLRVVYRGDDVLGLDSLKLRTSKTEFELHRSLDEKLNSWDVGLGSVSEWFQVSVDDDEMLQELMAPGGIDCRLEGSRGHADIDIFPRMELQAAIQLRDYLATQK